MDLHLSATSIKDFLVCNQRYYYRINYPEESSTNEDMEVGTGIHKLVEVHALDENFMKLAEEASKRFTAKKYADKYFQCAYNFYHDPFIHQIISKDDLVEKSFKIKIAEDVYIVGKMDRVTEDGVVIDWKTSKNTPKSIDDDIQFLVYYWAYHKLFSKRPAIVMHYNLYNGEYVTLKITDKYNTLFDEVIPGIIRQIKSGNYYKSGIYTGGCYMCNFKQFCLGVEQ